MKLYAIQVPSCGYFVSSDNGYGFCSSISNATLFNHEEAEEHIKNLGDPAARYIYINDSE
jgi:hypothetical protein